LCRRAEAPPTPYLVPMRTYRAYLLNPAGKIVWGDWVEAADQNEAEAKARELCKEGVPTVELWHGAQRLADVPCDPRKPVRRVRSVPG
jgi:hypothetical protein